MNQTYSQKKLNTYTSIVKSVLTESQSARDSDDVLFVEVHRRLNPNLVKLSIDEFFNLPRLPSYNAVSRLRRKVQRENPELMPTERIEAARIANEALMRGFLHEAEAKQKH